MKVTVEPLRTENAQSIVDAEDDSTVRWLSGGRSTLEGTHAYVERLAIEAASGATKRAFGIRVDGAFVGTIDFDNGPADGLEPGDVNIAYGVASWVRGQGVATQAVEILCSVLREREVSTHAVIRADERNPASARVAEKAGFEYIRDVPSSTETDEIGLPVNLRVFRKRIQPRPASPK